MKELRTWSEGFKGSDVSSEAVGVLNGKGLPFTNRFSVSSNIRSCLSATIKPIGKLIAVTSKVFDANFMESAVGAALEQGKGILDGVGAVLAFYVRPYVINHTVIHKTALADYVVGHSQNFIGFELFLV